MVAKPTTNIKPAVALISRSLKTGYGAGLPLILRPEIIWPKVALDLISIFLFSNL
jgi:hypothetical protein